jgi:senataxin
MDPHTSWTPGNSCFGCCAQGREKEVVIFSAVRSAARRRARIGFVADERRINVGLTRARASLLLVGNLRALRADAHWAALIKHATERRCAPLLNPKPP